jgi:hypothetical protein
MHPKTKKILLITGASLLGVGAAAGAGYWAYKMLYERAIPCSGTRKNCKLVFGGMLPKDPKESVSVDVSIDKATRMATLTIHPTDISFLAGFKGADGTCWLTATLPDCIKPVATTSVQLADDAASYANLPTGGHIALRVSPIATGGAYFEILRVLNTTLVGWACTAGDKMKILKDVSITWKF